MTSIAAAAVDSGTNHPAELVWPRRRCPANEAARKEWPDVLTLRRPDGVLIHDSRRGQADMDRTDRHIIKGSPELALLAFVFLAIFANILSQEVS